MSAHGRRLLALRVARCALLGHALGIKVEDLTLSGQGRARFEDGLEIGPDGKALPRTQGPRPRVDLVRTGAHVILSVVGAAERVCAVSPEMVRQMAAHRLGPAMSVAAEIMSATAESAKKVAAELELRGRLAGEAFAELVQGAADVEKVRATLTAECLGAIGRAADKAFSG